MAIVIGLLFIFFYFKENNLSLVTFDEKSKIDYKVYLKENEFYDEPYLGKDMLYVASLIDKIGIDFDYNFASEVKENINFTLARLIVFVTGNEVTLFKPVKYSFLAPCTCTTDITYSDIKEFEKDLMENYFTLRKYWFEYNMREHSI